MYPIGSPKGALNTKRTPEFIGTLKFKRVNGEYTLNRFIANYDVKERSSFNEKFYPPSEVIKFLKSQAVFLTKKDEDMEEFLKDNDIKYRFTKICEFCTMEGNITIINSKFSYKFHNQIICKDCAIETIKRELKVRHFNKKSFKNFKRLLNKTNSLETVLSILSPHFDPSRNPNLTLYDTVKVKKDNIPEIDMSRLKIPTDFREILINKGNTKLLPIQILAIKEGLLKDKDILAVSATGSGKTLIGELAGIPKALNGEKFIFLTPLVALANQKYRDFKKKYKPLGLTTAIKVGMNRVKAKGELNLPNSDIDKSDIIVGTYEAIDYLLRSGKKDTINNLGVILIDEIHMIDDEDRGARLNGLIRRIKYLYPKTQLIGLSATVKNPKFLANTFDMNLVTYENRPVPLERHLTYVRNESEKANLIRKLVKKEAKRKSKKGYKGQTIVFTNSRRKTHKITKYLSNNGINASAYHAGLSYFKKEKIEKDFDKGKIDVVVTTAALAAGVDFPASQVIFENLLMGNKYISPNEFSQMLGRAGRPSYHDKGIVYLIAEIGNEFDNVSEEAMALELLESNSENVHIEYSEDDELEEILADVSSNTINSIDSLNKFYKNSNVPMAIDSSLNELIDNGLIYHIGDKIETTKLGRAVSMSFLNIHEAEFIKNSIKNSNYLKESQYIVNNLNKIANTNFLFKKPKPKNKNSDNNKGKSKKNKKQKAIKIKRTLKINELDRHTINHLKVKSIALELELFSNAYLSPIVHTQIVNAIKTNFSSRLFAESCLDIISSGDTIAKLDQKFQDCLIKLQIDFLNCNCQEKPFCDCLQRGVSYLIVNERLNGHDPMSISKKLYKQYQIHIYPGDIFSYLDIYLKNLDAIKRIAYAINNKAIYNEAEKLIKAIENPEK